MKVKVLMVATSHWFPTARLAMALVKAGCEVDAVCPPQHPLCQTRAVRRTHKYRGLMPVSSLAAAIAASQPHIVIPGDDLATQHLHHLYQRERKRGDAGRAICDLIERSFGTPESFPIVYQRATFMRLAESEGVRTPKCAIISSLDDLRNWTSQMGLPTVLKADGTSGGDGVRVVQTLAEGERAYHKLKAPPLVARAAKRALIDHDKTLIWPSLLRRGSVVSAQTYIPGREGTSTVACWKGSVLAQLDFEVINKKYAAGPATVMRLIENADMTTAVEKMVRRLGLSGLHGFDFMLEADTGHAYLIEINPRTTQVGHLTLGPGRDLPAALSAALSSSAVQPAAPVTENDTITLFPQEWMRDPASPFIQSGYHDVPWEEPELMRACVQRALKPSRLQRTRPAEASIPVRVAAGPVMIKPELNESRHE
ncbi:MAG TPA: ATP-grasp domain-containing protein [Candidatus Sulfotelmatobacter sp.]|nr:ATP-grasp domain-containing protein [Candidatus Sulfotelmatobacter sp.]